MGWLVLPAILILPFVLAAISRYAAARIGLLLFWLACAGGVVFLRLEIRKIEKDLETVHTYALPRAPGLHRIEISRLSQGSMKGLLRGGRAAVRTELEKLRWAFQGELPVTCFDLGSEDAPAAGELLLFHVDWPGWKGNPVLEYHVDEPQAALLEGRTLVVSHDRSARHLLEDHALSLLKILGWGLAFWSGLWMVVQAVQEVKRRRRAKLGTAG